MKYDEPKSTVLNALENLVKFKKRAQYSTKLNAAERELFDNIIQDLDEAAHGIEFYDNHPLYMLLHKQLRSLLQGSIPIYAFEIRINLRPGNHAPARLQFDLFPKEKAEKEPFEFS